MEFLIQHFKAMKEKFINNGQIFVRIMTIWYKFNKYYKLTDETACYAAAVLLHSELRESYLRTIWAEDNETYIQLAI